jgi:hypothetical protein
MANAFLGRGLRFPIDVDASGLLQLAGAEDKVRDSVLLILGTVQGERQMRPDFGSRIQEQVFAALRPSTFSRIAFHVQEALIQWEPRIEVQSVRARADESEDGVVLVSVDYTVRATNTRFNLVYPFFIAGAAA